MFGVCVNNGVAVALFTNVNSDGDNPPLFIYVFTKNNSNWNNVPIITYEYPTLSILTIGSGSYISYYGLNFFFDTQMNNYIGFIPNPTFLNNTFSNSGQILIYTIPTTLDQINFLESITPVILQSNTLFGISYDAFYNFNSFCLQGLITSFIISNDVVNTYNVWYYGLNGNVNVPTYQPLSLVQPANPLDEMNTTGWGSQGAICSVKSLILQSSTNNIFTFK